MQDIMVEMPWEYSEHPLFMRVRPAYNWELVIILQIWSDYFIIVARSLGLFGAVGCRRCFRVHYFITKVHI